MRKNWLAAVGLGAAALTVAACGGSAGTSGAGGSASPPASAASQMASPHESSPGAAAAMLRTAKVHGVTVLTSPRGFALYWFSPDTATSSKCTGSCATIWPPLRGRAIAPAAVSGKLGTITRSDGTTQVTYNGHPLYLFTKDHAPGEATGNGVSAFGGVWHEVTVSGAAPASSPSPSSGGGGGY